MSRRIAVWMAVAALAGCMPAVQPGMLYRIELADVDRSSLPARPEESTITELSPGIGPRSAWPDQSGNLDRCASFHSSYMLPGAPSRPLHRDGGTRRTGHGAARATPEATLPIRARLSARWPWVARTTSPARRSAA